MFKTSNAYTRKFNKNVITMSLRVNDKQLLENYNKIRKKTERLMSIDFESKSVYAYDDDDDDDDDDKYIKAKIKIYADNIITNFHNKKMPIEKAPCKCLSIIMLDSVIKANKKYYPQTFLEECKYVQEKIKFENYINYNLDSDSYDETKSDNDNDNDGYDE